MAEIDMAGRVRPPAGADATQAMAIVVASIIGASLVSLPTPRAPVLGTIATAVVYMLSLMAVFGVVPTPKHRQEPA